MLDIIFLVAIVAGVLLGVLRGFVKQIFVLAGVLVVSVGTSYLSPVVARWLENSIQSDTVRSLVAMGATFILVSILYAVVTAIISHVISKTPGLGMINRILGAVFAVVVVYLSFGFVTAVVVETPQDMLPSLKSFFGNSWVVNNIYGGAESPERNFFGHWLVQVLIEKIQALAPDLTPSLQAMTFAV